MTAASTFRCVWRVVAEIPEGRVATYGQIAKLLGNPRGARTVSWALHSLPAGEDVPWHRVVSATGQVRPGSPQHAVALQCALLETEGVIIGAGNTVDLDAFGWEGLAPSEVEALLLDPEMES